MKKPRILLNLFICCLLLVGCLGRSKKASTPAKDTPTATRATVTQPTLLPAEPTKTSTTVPVTAATAVTPRAATDATATATARAPTPTAASQDGRSSYAGGRLGYDDEYVAIPEVAELAAALDYDPARCFAFVRDEVAFESYLGILRGARGTLWGRAGNAADQAVLLYALLRESGIEVQFARGTLGQADSQVLLQTMFTPALESGLTGVAPSGLVADPLNNPALLSEAADHLWVQMVTSQGWMDLDPSFPDAQMGDRYADPIATFTQPPDQLYHWLSVRVRLERITPEGLKLTYPLEYEGRVSDMVGQKIEYGHILEQMSSLQGAEAVQIGRVIAAQQRRYQPVLHVGERGVVGEAFTEAEGLDLDAPVGRMAQALGDRSEEAGPLSGEWLEFTLIYPDGRQEKIERAVFDRLGPSARTEGDLDRLARLDMTELLLSTHLSILIAPCDIPAEVGRAQVNAAVGPLLIAYENLRQHLDAKLAAGVESETRRFALDALLPYSAELWMELAFALNMAMASAADEALTDAAALVAVERYYDSPRIVISELTSLLDGGTAFSLDLRRDTVRVLAHPGQDAAAEFAFHAGRGVFEAALEGEMLEAMTGQPAITAPFVFAEAQAQGIEAVTLTPEDRAQLEELALPKDAKVRISEALDLGYSVVVPERFVPLATLDNEPRVAWWRVDPATNEVVGVLDSGLHQAGTIMVNLLVTWGSDKLGGKICGYCDTAPLDILIGASVTLVDFAKEIISAVNAHEDANKSIKDACKTAQSNIHDTAIQIAMATNKPEAVWRFELGANFAVPPVCR